MRTTRRVFLTTALALPACAAWAQPARAGRVALLSAFPRKDVEPLYAAVRSEFEAMGWSENKNVDFLPLHTTEGRNDLLPALAAEIVRQSPDVILVQSAPATRALMQATTTIPIVMIAVGDPVAYGIVRSYREPGGNVTGTSYLVNETSRKALELLKDMSPRIAAVGMFFNPANERAAPRLKYVNATGPALGLRILPIEAKSADDFPAAFDAIVGAKCDSVLLLPEPLIRSQRASVVRFAAEHRIAVVMIGGVVLLADGRCSPTARQRGSIPSWPLAMSIGSCAVPSRRSFRSSSRRSSSSASTFAPRAPSPSRFRRRCSRGPPRS